jgi:hypothetical protein
MLVSVVKLSQFPEQIATTLVWLDLVENVYRATPQVLYYSARLKSLVLRGAIMDGKIDVPLILNRRDASFSEGPCSVIKGATEIVDSVSQDRSDGIGNIRHTRDAVDELSCLRIVLFKDSVRIGSKEGIASGLQITDVQIGPDNLCRQSFVGVE